MPFSRATAHKARLLKLLKLLEENSFLNKRIYLQYIRFIGKEYITILGKILHYVQNDRAFSRNSITKLPV